MIFVRLLAELKKLVHDDRAAQSEAQPDKGSMFFRTHRAVM